MQTLKAVDPSTAPERTRELLAAAEQRLRTPARLRALITTTVTELNGCDYTLSAAMLLGSHAGVSGPELNAARQIRACDPKTAAAPHFAADLVQWRGNYLNLVAQTDIDFPVVKSRHSQEDV